jgi:hypothetical protein
MNKGLHKFCVYSAAVMVGLFTVATISAGIFPPPSPLRTAAEVANWLNDHALRARIGYIVGMFGSAFMMPFAAAIAWETQRMTDGDLPKGAGTGNNVAANIQLITGLMFGAALFFPFLVFMGAAFRPLQNIYVTQGINDTAWMMFVAPVSTATLQLFLLGYAMLADKQRMKTFPRWFAYYTIFTGFDFAGGGFCVLTKTGPFAWDGVISYYIPFVTWGLWCTGMILYMTQAIEREHAADRSAESAIATPQTAAVTV